MGLHRTAEELLESMVSLRQMLLLHAQQTAVRCKDCSAQGNAACVRHTSLRLKKFWKNGRTMTFENATKASNGVSEKLRVTCDV